MKAFASALLVASAAAATSAIEFAVTATANGS